MLQAPNPVAQSISAGHLHNPSPAVDNRGIGMRAAGEGHQTAHSSEQCLSPEMGHITSIMQQMDEMRAEFARLRQFQMENPQTPETIGGGIETVSTILPAYASVDERFRHRNANIHQAHIYRSASFTSVNGGSEVESTHLPEYSSVDGRIN